ncbi:MAG: cytochrome c biogenesis protein ResB [Nitrospirae bacterium]|nr:cytochrome c biogenesis protein ResB [Nitrospirota bacterium]
MVERKKGLVDRIWDLFASVKFAVVLFLLIALTSIIGTVIEQGAEPEKNLMLLKRLFGDSLAPSAFRLFESLGFMDMYRSWWFVSLLVLFAANLIICSLDRLPRIWRLATEPIKPLSPRMTGSVPIRREVRLKGPPEAVRERLEEALSSIGFKAGYSPDEDGGYQLYSQKGGYTRLGVYITHLSIIVIMLGAVIGIFFGFKGYMPIQEGYTADFAYGRDDTTQSLGFAIRCDDFDVEFYDMSDMPKVFRSRLTVIRDGREVMKKVVEVNSPLRYGGYTFYQSNYGMVPDADGYFILKVRGRTGKAVTINRMLGESFVIPGTEIVGTIRDFSPALAMDDSGKTFTYSNMMNNPAVYIEFSEGGKERYAGWILRRFPSTWRLPDGNVVELVDYWGVQYTGLQVRKDPGVWLVYLGSGIMTLGLCIAFFMSHRRVWVLVGREGRHSAVTVLASANKNRQAFERKIDKLVSALSGGSDG